MNSKLLALRLRLHKMPTVATWEAAVTQAAQGGYEADGLTRFRAERMKLNLLAGRIAHTSAPVSRALAWLKDSVGPLDRPFVVDFGGADGAFLSKLRDEVPGVQGVVVESEALVKALGALDPKPADYASDLPDRFEVFYSSCALNYVQEPYSILERAFATASVAVVLQRNCFSNQEQFRVQWSSLHANGWGEVPPGWPDRLVRYPHRTLVPSHIIQQARRHGFTLTDMQGNTTGVIGRPGTGMFGVDLFFSRRG